MLNRGNLALLCLLIAQIAALALMVFAGAGAESRVVEPLLADFDASRITALTIADDIDASISLVRADDNWMLPAADEFPVDGGKVDELLRQLASLDNARLVATNPGNFPRLLVADTDFRRKLSLSAGDRDWTLFLGGSGGSNTAYARLESQNEVYLGKGISAWDASTQATNWIDASYVEVPQADLLRLDVTNANGSFSFARDADDWTYLGLPDAAEFEDTTLPSLLRNAASIRMVNPLGLAALDVYGMDQPAATVDVTYRQLVATEADHEPGDADDAAASDESAEPTYSESSYTLVFGAVMDDGDIALKSSANDYYVAVRESVMTAFSQLRHEDLLRAPETDAQAQPAD